MAHYEPPHLDLHCLRILLFSVLALKGLNKNLSKLTFLDKGQYICPFGSIGSSRGNIFSVYELVHDYNLVGLTKSGKSKACK